MEITRFARQKRATWAVGRSTKTSLRRRKTAEAMGLGAGRLPHRADGRCLERDDLFVQEAAGRIVGAAIINRVQVDVYADVTWQYPAEDEQVMMLHTPVIEPAESRQGLGKAFVEFYEGYAAENGCAYLRMDQRPECERPGSTGSWATGEAGVVPCVFNGIFRHLVMLEKRI